LAVAEGEQRCRMHLDRADFYLGAPIHLLASLPVRGIWNPDRTGQNRVAGESQVHTADGLQSEWDNGFAWMGASNASKFVRPERQRWQ